ncbi:hypothetical protein GCM10007052_37080 [Halioglobus japonicus]|nr:hypothetical protein GCM10007052_37080 [Halioglobus japonicus]
MTHDAIDRDFYEGKRSESFPFCINDSVAIRRGPGIGKGAAVVSIASYANPVEYLVEPGDGSGDLVVPVTDLEAI